MAEYKDREHFIPLRKAELVDLLCADKELPAAERDLFRQFCRLVEATYHFEYNQLLQQLKNAYAPFDPDSDTQALVKLRSEERQRRLNDLFSDFGLLLGRANFKHLSREDIEPTLQHASDWGINVDVDFGVFERIALFARGDTLKKRTRRRVRNLYRLEETRVPVFQRLVLILKMRQHRRLGRNVDTDSVYLKIFKDMPKLDIKMLLPGAQVHLSYFDRSKIGFPLISGIGTALYNIADDVLLGIAKAGANPWAMWGIATGAFGYGTRSYFNYQGTKQRYNLNLTQSLYYQNLDSNSGVLFRLMDEAEEQEFREAILAYYFLWRHAGQQGWTSGNLDDFIELWLERYANVKVDFEIGDALAKLEKLRIVQKVGDHYRAQPLNKALEMVDWTWDNYFKYNNPEPETPPIP